VKSYKPTTVPASPEFAERLREAIQSSEYSLRDLEEETGVDKNTISSWQNANSARRPSSVSLNKVGLVAELLDLDLGTLLGISVPTEEAAEREELLRELHKELEALEAPTAELAERLGTIERLSMALPELRQLAAKALRSSNLRPG
jgi:transcriptional regulator with XRE-family HTH domain